MSTLTEDFADLLEITWSEFVAREADPLADNVFMTLSSLVRTAKDGNIRAFQEGINRMDGKIAQEVEFELPSYYTLYPNATSVSKTPSLAQAPPQAETELPDDDDNTPVTPSSLQDVLTRMMRKPKDFPTEMLRIANHIDDNPDDLQYGDPKVKTVMVAGFMRLVHARKVGAVTELFDRLDGKVREKVKLLGSGVQEVYFTDYSLVAPHGAVKNSDGVYQVEASHKVVELWNNKLLGDKS